MLQDPALEARARELGQGAALPRLPEPVDRRFRCRPRPRPAPDRARAAGGRRQRCAGDLAYLVDRYGEFVLLSPPFEPATWLLWLGPPRPCCCLGPAPGGLLRVAPARAPAPCRARRRRARGSTGCWPSARERPPDEPTASSRLALLTLAAIVAVLWPVLRQHRPVARGSFEARSTATSWPRSSATASAA